MVLGRDVSSSTRQATDSNRLSRVSRSSRPNLRQVNISSNVGVKPKASRSTVAKPKNYLAWYVPRKTKTLHIPQITWKCPPKFALNVDWQVAAGEESKEVEVQKRRECTAVEAHYPHPSAIPASPFVSPDVGCNEFHDDNTEIPLIPIIPIEEIIEAGASSSSSKVEDESAVGMLSRLQSGDLAIAIASFAAAMQAQDHIDPQLLIEILRKAIDENGSQTTPESGTTQVSSTSFSIPSPLPVSEPGSAFICANPAPKPTKYTPLQSSVPEQSFNSFPGLSNSSIRARGAQKCTTKPVKISSPLPSSKPNEPPSEPNEVHKYAHVNKISAGVKHVRTLPLNQSTSIPRVQVFNKMNDYESGGVNPVVAPPLVHNPIAVRNNMEEMNRNSSTNRMMVPVANRYAFANTIEQRGDRMIMSVVNRHAVANTIEQRGLFHFSPLIRNHGEIHETQHQSVHFGLPGNHTQGLVSSTQNNEVSNEFNSNNQQRFMYLRGPRGYQNSYNIPHQYQMTSNQSRGGEAMEVPVPERMRFSPMTGNYGDDSKDRAMGLYMKYR